jgi:hypothetical protein
MRKLCYEIEDLILRTAVRRVSPFETPPCGGSSR